MFYKFFKEESGQGLVEYSFLIGLLAIFTLTALSFMGQRIGEFCRSILNF